MRVLLGVVFMLAAVYAQAPKPEAEVPTGAGTEVAAEKVQEVVTGIIMDEPTVVAQEPVVDIAPSVVEPAADVPKPADIPAEVAPEQVLEAGPAMDAPKQAESTTVAAIDAAAAADQTLTTMEQKTTPEISKTPTTKMPTTMMTPTVKPTASPPGRGGETGCHAPNGGGLQSVLDEFAKEIPVEQLYRRIIMAIATDSETQLVLQYVISPEFHDLLLEVLRSPQLAAFVNFACNELYLDVRYYFNMLLSLFGLPEFPRIPARAASPGFRGFFLDMLDMIPTEKLKLLLNERMQTDEYLKISYPKLKSPAFKAYLGALHNSTAYSEMLMGLREIHVDVDIFIATIHRSLM